ncbi:hypothetical protein A3B57_03905 [Microgenomates group bacterium RIFCSPLOWO2_01_FULL_47_10]|nr:MAG: hypothetical protein A3B57_03905 [Microgenomates group bacterium RIFCSPLOWO2_01_FULL_47_10]
MNDFQFISQNSEPDPADKQIMVDGMLAYHASQGHPRQINTYSIIMKDHDKTIGCVVVTFLWNGMEIQSLWVDETVRKQGYGRKLMAMAEEEAIKRGCGLAYTNTFTWQAPGFYQKIGYSEYGKLEDFPAGNTLFYFSKRLSV